MSDLRNFSGNSEEPAILSERIPESNLASETRFRDTGGLSGFHHAEEEDETSSNTSKLVGAAVVVVLLCGAGAYAYMSSSATPKSPVAATNLPAPSAPQQQTAANMPAPAPAMQTAPTPPAGNDNAAASSPYGAAPASNTAPAATPASAPDDATVNKHPAKHAIRAAKKEATENTQEAQTTNKLNTQ
jgi:hypothetical protein